MPSKHLAAGSIPAGCAFHPIPKKMGFFINISYFLKKSTDFFMFYLVLIFFAYLTYFTIYCMICYD